MAGQRVGEHLGERMTSLGEFIAAQRRAAQLSLRQLSEQAGVSNPYLSQIERGLRRPSAEVLQQLAKALQVSAETLFVRAGILDPDDGRPDVVGAIWADERLSSAQKAALLAVYAEFARDQAASEMSTNRQGNRT